MGAAEVFYSPMIRTSIGNTYRSVGGLGMTGFLTLRLVHTELFSKSNLSITVQIFLPRHWLPQ